MSEVIKYEKDSSGRVITPCPHDFNAMVGSVACTGEATVAENCKHCKSVDRVALTVECNFLENNKSKKG